MPTSSWWALRVVAVMGEKRDGGRDGWSSPDLGTDVPVATTSHALTMVVEPLEPSHDMIPATVALSAVVEPPGDVVERGKGHGCISAAVALWQSL